MGPPEVTTQAKPAFYALAPGGWRDYVTLLHPPYTAWHLSYVVIGFGLAPELHPWRLLAALAAFFLALGVGAHALDELNGRPLRTRIGDGTLIVLAVSSIGGAVAIGIGAAIAFSFPLLAFVAVGAFLVAAYNLELFGGRFHTDLWFGLAWGAFPVLTGYFGAAETLRLEAFAAAVFATLTSLAQRVLSTPVRHVRRRVARVTGSLELVDGRREEITEETLLRGPEKALRALAAATVALAAALVLTHV